MQCLSTATSSTTTLSGIIILVGYMSFDAFTSNWQGELFNQHKMSSVQMMCGVNLFSCLLTTTSLVQQGTFGVSLQFMFTYPAFFWDGLILSVSSVCAVANSSLWISCILCIILGFTVCLMLLLFTM